MISVSNVLWRCQFMMDFHQLVDAKAMQIINPKGNIRHGMGGGGHLLPPMRSLVTVNKRPFSCYSLRIIFLVIQFYSSFLSIAPQSCILCPSTSHVKPTNLGTSRS